MEQLIVEGKGIPPKIIEKAREALITGHRRPVLGTAKSLWQINVDYRYRLLLRGDDKARLMTHERMNRYLSSRPKRSR